MTDRERMQMALDALEQPSPIGGFNNQEYVAKALRDRLEHPEPVHAIDISQERVDETAKHEHEFFCPRCGHCCRDGLERLCRIMGTFDLATGHADTMDEALDALESELRDVLGYLRARSEWVGLTHEERDEIDQNCRSQMEALFAIEAKLKEKNT